MNESLFAPKGEVAEWELVYGELSKLNVGDILTYEHLSEILGRDFRVSRSPLTKAEEQWGAEHQRALDCVRGVGYRVVEAAEHERLARRHHRKSQRSMHRGKNVLSRADRSQLSPEERERIDRLELNMARQADFMRQIDTRVHRVEQAINQGVHTVDTESRERIAALEEALARNGIALTAEKKQALSSNE